MSPAVQATVAQIRAAGIVASFVTGYDDPNEVKVSRGLRGMYVAYDRATDTYSTQAYSVDRRTFDVTMTARAHGVMTEQMLDGLRVWLR